MRRLAVLLLLALVAACGGGEPATKAGAEAPVLRLGYFPNVTHAPAIAGVERGLIAKALGKTKLEPFTFNAGPQAVEALFSGGLDATYIGPNPAINAFVQSKGEAIRIIAGSTSGGAALVVKPAITKPADLKGKKLATPSRGNTQDVALRAWLKANGLTSDLQGGGDVAVNPQDNAQTLETFRSGAIDGAWVPEPWATRLVVEGGGKVLVDERTLWPNGDFVTTHLIVRTEYLKANPGVIRRLLDGHIAALDYLNFNQEDGKKAVNEGIKKITGKALPDEIISKAWLNLRFTADPIATSLLKSASDATAAGLLAKTDLKGIYDLTILNEALAAAGKPKVSS